MLFNDVAGNAATYPIVISASPYQSIIGYGASYTLGTNDGSAQFTFSHNLQAWTVQVGPAGTTGATGAAGTAGTAGATGAQGPSGGALDFAMFYANMPGDNASTVPIWTSASSAALQFPRVGPAKAGTAITQIGTNAQLGAIGIYLVTAQVTTAEAAQLALELQGVPLDGTLGLPNTVVGRATGTSESVISAIITTTVVNSLLRVINYKSAAALTITPNEGGSEINTCSLTIVRLA